MADALDLGSCAARRVGSSPTFRTKRKQIPSGSVFCFKPAVWGLGNPRAWAHAGFEPTTLKGLAASGGETQGRTLRMCSKLFKFSSAGVKE